jgi:hypothetical protein
VHLQLLEGVPRENANGERADEKRAAYLGVAPASCAQGEHLPLPWAEPAQKPLDSSSRARASCSASEQAARDTSEQARRNAHKEPPTVHPSPLSSERREHS